MLIITPSIYSFYFMPYFAHLQDEFVWKINSSFNNMPEKYFLIILPLIILE